jgi:hypothetical protein
MCKYDYQIQLLSSDVIHFFIQMYSYIFILLFIVVLGRGTLEYLQRFLQCITYLILEFTTSAALFHPPFLIPGTVSTGIIFAFTYTCIHYWCHLPLSPGATLIPHASRQN